MFNMGMAEWSVVLVIILIFFGPKNLPKLAQSIGKSVRELKNGLGGLGDDIKDTLTSPPETKSEMKRTPESHVASHEQPKDENETPTPIV